MVASVEKELEEARELVRSLRGVLNAESRSPLCVLGHAWNSMHSGSTSQFIAFQIKGDLITSRDVILSSKDGSLNASL